MEFVVIDNCPVPSQLANDIQRIKALSGAHLNSCDRSPEAEPVLRKCGKHSQRELYEMFLHHVPDAKTSAANARRVRKFGRDEFAAESCPSGRRQ